jgi:hypothetical protein
MPQRARPDPALGGRLTPHASAMLRLRSAPPRRGAVGGDDGVPDLPGGDDRVELAQQCGDDGGLGLGGLERGPGWRSEVCGSWTQMVTALSAASVALWTCVGRVSERGEAYVLVTLASRAG